MSKQTGRLQNVGIAREATRGTPVVPAFWIPKTNFTVEDKVMKAPFMGNYGVLAGGDAAPVTEKWAEGVLEMEVTDKNIGLLLYAMFGTLSSGSFNSVYKHTLTIQNSVQPTTLTLWMKDLIADDASKTLAYAMAMVDYVEFKVELGELVKTTVGFISKVHKDWTELTPSYTAENKFRHQDLRLKIAANTAALDAASKVNVQSYTIRFQRSVARENALGTVQPVDIVSRAFKISGSMKLTYEDRTYRDYMLDGTTKAMRFSLVKGDSTIGATNPQVQIDLPVVHFDQWEAAHPNEEVATQEVNFEALYDVSNSILIGANSFVVNEQASY